MASSNIGVERLPTSEIRGRLASIDLLSQWERAELGRELRRAGLSYGEIAEFIQLPRPRSQGGAAESRSPTNR